jgi:small multidrug resistance family-3 protein
LIESACGRVSARVAASCGWALGSQRWGAYCFGTRQEDSNFGRVLAAYGGIFVAGALAGGVVADGFRPDRFDLAGAAICLIGVAVIMWASR